MSKIGNLPIKLPDGVTLELERQTVKVVGPKGGISWQLPEEITLERKEGLIFLVNKRKTKRTNALHGTARAIVANMVKGVTNGWVKKLELVGAGYKADVAGDILNLAIGYSHPVKIKVPQGVTFKVEKTIITIEGVDRELVGQVAAKIRSIRPPEPYKGKGIKYQDEVIKRKAGKAAAKVEGGASG